MRASPSNERLWPFPDFKLSTVAPSSRPLLPFSLSLSSLSLLQVPTIQMIRKSPPPASSTSTALLKRTRFDEDDAEVTTVAIGSTGSGKEQGQIIRAVSPNLHLRPGSALASVARRELACIELAGRAALALSFHHPALTVGHRHVSQYKRTSGLEAPIISLAGAHGVRRRPSCEL